MKTVSTIQVSEGLEMAGLCIGAPKDRCLSALFMAVVGGPLLATLCFAAGQMPGFEQNVSSRKKVTLIVHVADQGVRSIAPSSARNVQVIEHGKTLEVVDGPRRGGSKQIALLLDANFHQQKVFALEQQTAGELLSEIEMEKDDAQALLMSYGTEIRSSGGLTNEWAGLRGFVGSLRAETDKHNETVLLYDAMKRAFEKLGDGPGTKAVVVFAEGNDHGSSIGWVSLARLAQRAHIACYVVLFADHSFYGREVRHYGYYLVELSTMTGGILWEVGGNSRKARDAAQQLSSEVDSQTLLEVLTPDVRANRFHPVKIIISPGSSVKAQTGYYDDLAR